MLEAKFGDNPLFIKVVGMVRNKEKFSRDVFRSFSNIFNGMFWVNSK